MFVSDEQQGFVVSGGNLWVLAAFIDFSSSGERQSPPLRQIFKLQDFLPLSRNLSHICVFPADFFHPLSIYLDGDRHGESSEGHLDGSVQDRRHLEEAARADVCQWATQEYSGRVVLSSVQTKGQGHMGGGRGRPRRGDGSEKASGNQF